MILQRVKPSKWKCCKCHLINIQVACQACGHLPDFDCNCRVLDFETVPPVKPSLH